MTDHTSHLPLTLRAIRAKLNLTQEQLADRLGVSFATVNRWEGGGTKPQRAAMEAITALAHEAGLDDEPADALASTPSTSGRRRGHAAAGAVPTTKPMEQMLWDAACSIRGEKDAPKFKDYLLPLLFLKRLSDVFDDEIGRLAEEYGDRATALEIAESDHSLLRFYLPPEARWGVISGREAFDWPADDRGRATAPRTSASTSPRPCAPSSSTTRRCRACIDVVDFAAERNGERDINPAKLRGVVETFSDPRYRLGLADVQPDFLGRAYEYLLRKFAEGSGQSAGEFFTPTEVGFLMAHIMRPRPGEDLPRLRLRLGRAADQAAARRARTRSDQHACRSSSPARSLQAESYAVAQMNAIIHDMEVELARGDTMINPKFRDGERQDSWPRHRGGQPDVEPAVRAGPVRQRSVRPLPHRGRHHQRQGRLGLAAAHPGLPERARTRRRRARHRRRHARLRIKNEDKERNIRKWFVDQDLIDGVILLPENLFYNTTAAGVIVVLEQAQADRAQGQDRAAQRKPSLHERPAQELLA